MRLSRVWSPLLEQAYVQQVKATIGVALPHSYLQRGEVLALTDGSLVRGGFSVIHTGPFRSMAQLPDGVRVTLEARLAQCPRVVEVNGLFLHRTVSDADVLARFWAGLANALGRSGATHAVFSYASSATALGRLYQAFNPQRLYAGPVCALEGSKPDHEHIELTRVDTVRGLLTSETWVRRPRSRLEAA